MTSVSLDENLGLKSLEKDLVALRAETVRRAAETHVRYLDNRIDKIDLLSRYLNDIDTTDGLKQSYIERVRSSLHDDSLNITDYGNWYLGEHLRVWSEVDRLCDVIPSLIDGSLSAAGMASYWAEFAYWNELDNFHGMFLTSGRWNVNFMLPALKGVLGESLSKFGYCLSGHDLSELTQYLVTPEYAGRTEWPSDLLTTASSVLQSVLGGFDSVFMFLYDDGLSSRAACHHSVGDFAAAVKERPWEWSDMLTRGVFPPFAWHELHGRRSPKRHGTLDSMPQSEEVTTSPYQSCLRTLKALELRYHVYNYKGRFGLMTKPLYFYTAETLTPSKRLGFLRAILLDQFTAAARIVKEGVA